MIHPNSPLEIAHQALDWTAANWADMLAGLVLGVVVYLLIELFRSILGRICRRLAERSKGVFFTLLHEAVSGTSHLFIVVLAAELVVGYVNPPAALIKTVHFVFTVVAVVQAALWLRAIILGFIERSASPEGGNNEALANASGLIRALVNGALIVVALVVVLDNLGVNITGLVAGLGIGGIAIGLAAQGIFSDLFAALSILFDRPFKVGETIAVDGSAATVEKIGLKSTRLRAVTGEKRIISNAQLLSKDIMSYTGLDRRRFTYPIGLIYQTSPEDCARVPGLLKEIVEAEGGTFVRAGFTGFGASSLDFEVQFDVLNTNFEEIYAIRHSIGIALLKRFNDLGLSFAYPTQTTFTADPDGRMIMPYPANWPSMAQE